MRDAVSVLVFCGLSIPSWPQTPVRLIMPVEEDSLQANSCVMRPLRYSINVTLDGCCDHRAIFADEDLHRHAVENLDQADALLFGRVTYEMMEEAFRPRAIHLLTAPTTGLALNT